MTCGRSTAFPGEGGSGEKCQEVVGKIWRQCGRASYTCVTLPFENSGSQCFLQGLALTRHLVDGRMSVPMSAGSSGARDHAVCVSALSAAGAQH